jgi:hypothetical protein
MLHSFERLYAFLAEYPLPDCKSSRSRTAGEEALALMSEMWKFRDLAQRYAVAAAPYVHPRLAAVSHQHRGEDGSIVRPILVIEGYPADLDGPLKAIPAPEEEDGGGNGRH